MTLKEFDNIRHLLPEETEVIIKTTFRADEYKPRVGRFKIEDWGNHDGTLAVTCPACGWHQSRMKKNEIPDYCPKCGFKNNVKAF